MYSFGEVGKSAKVRELPVEGEPNLNVYSSFLKDPRKMLSPYNLHANDIVVVSSPSKVPGSLSAETPDEAAKTRQVTERRKKYV